MLSTSIGGANDDEMKRKMIHRTIKEHLDKELRLVPLGIKVLSLFFIDRVEYYRSYDSSGKPRMGKYGKMFEEEYAKIIKEPRYDNLLKDKDSSHSITDIHNGYFSFEKKGGWAELDLDVEGNPKNQMSRENAERAYHIIMRDKEKLLSFETPLKFIFSHSALREGWDNPNVFQICALRDMDSEIERR